MSKRQIRLVVRKPKRAPDRAEDVHTGEDLRRYLGLDGDKEIPEVPIEDVLAGKASLSEYLCGRETTD